MVGGKLEDWRGVKEGVSSDPQNNLNGITLGHYETQKHSHLFSAPHDWKGKIREFCITETGGNSALLGFQLAGIMHMCSKV